MGSRIVQEIIFGFGEIILVIFEKNDIEVGGGGGLASRVASANFLPEVLRKIQLVPDWWAPYGLFINAIDDHIQTTPEKLLTP